MLALRSWEGLSDRTLLFLYRRRTCSVFAGELQGMHWPSGVANTTGVNFLCRSQGATYTKDTSLWWRRPCHPFCPVPVPPPQRKATSSQEQEVAGTCKLAQEAWDACPLHKAAVRAASPRPGEEPGGDACHVLNHVSECQRSRCALAPSGQAILTVRNPTAR